MMVVIYLVLGVATVCQFFQGSVASEPSCNMDAAETQECAEKVWRIAMFLYERAENLKEYLVSD